MHFACKDLTIMPTFRLDKGRGKKYNSNVKLKNVSDFNTYERKKVMSEDNRFQQDGEFEPSELEIRDTESEDNNDTEKSRQDELSLRRANARNAGRQFRQRITEADEEEENVRQPLLSPAIKGIIAILIALILVALVILLFAKVLFLHEPNQEAKTGTITSTAATGTTPVTTTGLHQRQSHSTKETIKYNDNAKKTETGDGKTAVTKIKCISPVLVHPQPNSSSANLTTVPLNAQVDFIRDENGWYYITYNGITGYAWGQFFETPNVTNGGQNGQNAQ